MNSSSEFKYAVRLVGERMPCFYSNSKVTCNQYIRQALKKGSPPLEVIRP